MLNKANIQKLQIIKQKIEKESIRFSDDDRNILIAYCTDMGYKIQSFTKNLVKIESCIDDKVRFGALKRYKNHIAYGYIKDKKFVPKYSITNEINIYMLLKSFNDKLCSRRDLKLVCGLVDMEINY